MTDRSELALQLTDAVGAAYTAIQRAGDRAFRAFGLSHRAHAALTAVDRGGGDGARPKEIAEALGGSRAAATTFVQPLQGKGRGGAARRRRRGRAGGGARGPAGPADPRGRARLEPRAPPRRGGGVRAAGARDRR